MKQVEKNGETLVVHTREDYDDARRIFVLNKDSVAREFYPVDELRLMKVGEGAGHSIEYALGWKACVDWIKSGGDSKYYYEEVKTMNKNEKGYSVQTIADPSGVYLNAEDLITRIENHQEIVVGKRTSSPVKKGYALAHEHIIEIIQNYMEIGK